MSFFLETRRVPLKSSKMSRISFNSIKHRSKLGEKPLSFPCIDLNGKKSLARASIMNDNKLTIYQTMWKMLQKVWNRNKCYKQFLALLNIYLLLAKLLSRVWKTFALACIFYIFFILLFLYLFVLLMLLFQLWLTAAAAAAKWIIIY